MKRILLLINISVLTAVIDATDYVPVIMWDNVKTTVKVPTLQTLSMTQFSDVVYKKYQADPTLSILVFGENSLNLEDLTYQPDDEDLFAGMMEKLVNRDGMQLNFLLQVESPIPALMRFEMPTTIALNDEMVIPARPGEITILNFDESNYKNRRTMLHDHIERMMKMYNRWRTGAKSMLVFISGHRSRRLIDQETTVKRKKKTYRIFKPGTLLESEDIHLYVEDSILFVKHDNKNSTLIQCPGPKTETLDELPHSYFKLCGPDVEFTLTFINHPGGYWKLTTVTFTEPSSKKNLVVPTWVSAPTGYSYHCSKMEFANKHKDKVVLNGFQVQPFSVNVSKSKPFKFGPSADCAGILTKAIGAGLMVTFLMLFVLSYGLTMISNIRTNDRMENPKGPRVGIVLH